jgi:Xaa-Pro aminopeptidase
MTSFPELAGRRDSLIDLFAKARVDALLVSSPANVRYLSGFTGSNALLVVCPKRSWILTDPRYTIQVSLESDCKPKIVNRSLFLGLPAVVKRLGIRHLGYESACLSMTIYKSVREKLPRMVKLKAADGLVEELRMVKSASEIAAIRHSVNLNSRAFAAAMKRLKPGWSERRLAAELDYQMRRHGAEKTAFDTIVAAGPRTALPHARPTDEPVRLRRLILIDMGAQAAGYTSDMTRMACIGDPGRRWRALHAAVLEAQLAAIGAVREGAAAAHVDRAARSVLKSHKVDTYFVHSTGHGLGLDIHEPPRLARKEKTLLRAGMVITIEPGIYLEGRGGIRIEDTVLVTRTGCEILTPTPKEMLVL